MSPINSDGLSVSESTTMPFSISGITAGGEVPTSADAVILGEKGRFALSRVGASQELQRGEVYFAAGASDPLQVSGQGAAWLVEPRVD